jgi:hypothetical protein
MAFCFWKRNVGIHDISSIETKSHHITTRVVYVIGYTKCTQTPKILSYLGCRYTLPVPMVKWVHFLYLHLLRVGLRIFFPVVPLCQFFGCGGKWFLVLLPYLNDRQMTPRGYPNINSYMKSVLVFQTDGDTHCAWAVGTFLRCLRMVP